MRKLPTCSECNSQVDKQSKGGQNVSLVISATFQETIEFSCVLWKSFERSTLGSETVPVSDSRPWRAAGVSGGFPCAALELRG